MASAPKKRKIERGRDNQPKASAEKATTPSQDHLRSDVGVACRIAQNVLAKKHAVSQVLSDGCLGNFRSFDSQFGNYLVPVIPTRADLIGVIKPN